VSEPIISVSGLRGVVGESLTPLVAARYVTAFARMLADGPIVVGRDGRANGEQVLPGVWAALGLAGRRVLYADVAATPTLGILVRQHRAAGGIQLSASHNPEEYNGLKLFGPDGRVIPAPLGRRVLEIYRALDYPALDLRGLRAKSDYETLADTTSEHLRLLEQTVDAAAIGKRRFRILLDSNAGAGSILGRRLLESLGCEVHCLGEQPDGHFLHPPEPTAENLIGAGEQVLAAGADIGFCQDPDADRLAIIDETGRYLGEEYTLALSVDHVLRHRRGPVVTNCASSRMAEDLAAKYGVPFYRSAVGEANVVDKMLAVDAVFGGEGNGGPIDPRVGLVRDSFVGMALVLAAMSQRGKKVSVLADELPRYEIVKRTARLPADKLPALLDAAASQFADARPDWLDGLRLDWRDRWLILRGSNTEPLVRLIAEAPTAAAAVELTIAAANIIETLLND